MRQRLMDATVAAVRGIALACALLLAAGGSAAWAETATGQVYRVEAGSQLSIKLGKAVQRVAVGDGEIAQVKVLGKQELLLQGKKAGSTSLLVWSKGGSAPDSHRIQVDKAVNTALLAGPLRLKSSNDLMLLTGTSPDMAQHEQAREIARSAGGDKANLVDAAQLSYSGEVQIDVRVVELSRKVLKEAGFNLFSAASDNFTFGTFSPSSLKEVTASSEKGIHVDTIGSPVSKALTLLLGSASGDVIGLLSLLEGNGFARTLAQPTL
ncbi:MAG: type II and III secretion system protein family protein, partial [Thiobacillus sp.]|nr:type II and III secretion system protein family protein [Thiobacillus sp.]